MGDLAQLMMRKTESGGASDHIHACLHCDHPTSSMAGCARQAGQSFAESSIQALDKSGVQHTAPVGEQKQVFRLGHRSIGSRASDARALAFSGSA